MSLADIRKFESFVVDKKIEPAFLAGSFCDICC